MDDCARFVVEAGYSNQVNGQIVNAGLGRDIAINELALLIAGDMDRISISSIFIRKVKFRKLLRNSGKQQNYLVGSLKFTRRRN